MPSSARRSGAGCARRSRPTSTSGRRRASSRASSTRARPSSASSGSSTRRSSAARAATASTTPSGPRSSPPPAPPAGSAPASAPTPGSRRRRCTGSAPPISTSASCARRSPARKIAALGITEPGAGSDVASIRTEARKVAGGYVVNGSKTFITNGVRADFLVCAVKTTPEGGHQGISFLILERDMPGYEVTAQAREDGLALLRHGRALVHRRRGPGREPARRGEPRLLPDHGELRLGAAADGARRRRGDAPAAGDGRVDYAGEREAFGRPIGKFQAIRHKIAEIGVKAEVGRALTYHALRRYAAGEDVIADVTKAKLFTQRACVEVADEVVQILGGYGYMREYGVERALRDARLGPDRRRHRRGDEGDPRPPAGPVTRQPHARHRVRDRYID